MPDRSTHMRKAVVVLALAAVVAGVAGGCAALGRLPFVARGSRPVLDVLPELGGSLVLVPGDPEPYLVTSGGVACYTTSGLRYTKPLPPGYTLLEDDGIGEQVVLLNKTSRRLALWDPVGGTDVVPIPHWGWQDREMRVDLDGNGTSEIVTVTYKRFADTSTPLGTDERVEVWTVEQGQPKRVWRSPSQGEGITSLVTRLRVVTWGDGVALAWEQGRGDTLANIAMRTVVCVPGEPYELREGSRQDLVRVYPENDDGYRPPVRLPVTTSGNRSLEITATGSNSTRALLLQDSPPVGKVAIDTGAIEPVGATFADVDGDGADDIVIAGEGGPAICSDTRPGYVGWALASEDGGFGRVTWSKSLDGGLASLKVVDLDGRPGVEIIASVVNTFCQSTPHGLYVWRLGDQ
ncbi:MAG: hypothetical protein LLG24_00965 [Actinomycetia bacterium]|nr:hypothetical protein [Actinomycetes bacterium]